MLSEDIDQVLRDYFQWARVNAPEDIGYPHSIPTERLRRSVVGSVGISDDEAEWINTALCALNYYDKSSFEIVMKHYKEGKSFRWLHKNGYGDRRTLMSLASDGRQFVRGVLFGARMAG